MRSVPSHTPAQHSFSSFSSPAPAPSPAPFPSVRPSQNVEKATLTKLRSLILMMKENAAYLDSTFLQISVSLLSPLFSFLPPLSSLLAPRSSLCSLLSILFSLFSPCSRSHRFLSLDRSLCGRPHRSKVFTLSNCSAKQ